MKHETKIVLDEMRRRLDVDDAISVAGIFHIPCLISCNGMQSFRRNQIKLRLLGNDKKKSENEKIKQN